MTFKFKKAEKLLEPDGDIDVYGNYLPYLREVDESQLRKNAGFSPMPLMWISPNTWYDLQVLNFDMKQIRDLCKGCTNEDPYFRQEYYALFPLILFAKNPSIYFKHFDHEPYYQSPMCDSEWNRRNKEFEKFKMKEEDLPKMLHVGMGSGYNDGIMMNDGSAYKRFVCMDLENGDFVLAVTWEWFNK